MWIEVIFANESFFYIFLDLLTEDFLEEFLDLLCELVPSETSFSYNFFSLNSNVQTIFLLKDILRLSSFSAYYLKEDNAFESFFIILGEPPPFGDREDISPNNVICFLTFELLRFRFFFLYFLTL